MIPQQWHFKLTILHASLAITSPEEPNGFFVNYYWSKEHSRQGFLLAPGTAYFRAFEPENERDNVEEDYEHEIIVEVVKEYVEAPNAYRIIMVPFQVVHDEVTISSTVGDPERLSVPSGTYALYFSRIPNQKKEHAPSIYRFTLLPCNQAITSQILKWEVEQPLPTNLLLTAELEH